MFLLLSADFFFQKIVSGTLSVSNGLDLDQDQPSASPDLGPCLFDLILYVPVYNFQSCRAGLPVLNQY